MNTKLVQGLVRRSDGNSESVEPSARTALWTFVPVALCLAFVFALQLPLLAEMRSHSVPISASTAQVNIGVGPDALSKLEISGTAFIVDELDQQLLIEVRDSTGRVRISVAQDRNSLRVNVDEISSSLSTQDRISYVSLDIIHGSRIYLSSGGAQTEVALQSSFISGPLEVSVRGLQQPQITLQDPPPRIGGTTILILILLFGGVSVTCASWSHRERLPDLLASLTLQVWQIIFALPVFLKFLPVSIGWFPAWAAALSDNGPQATYIPLPRLSILLDGHLANMAWNPMLFEQLWSLLKWILLSTALYWTVRFFVKPLPALLGASIATSAYFAQPYNITAGYFELAILMSMLGTIVILFNQSRNTGMGYIVGGFFLTCAVLVKQNFGLVAFLIALAVLLISPRLHVRKAIGTVSVGVVLTLGLYWIVVLLVFEQSNPLTGLLTTGGKSPFTLQPVTWFFASLLGSSNYWIIFAGGGLLLLRKHMHADPYKVVWYAALSVLVLSIFGLPFLSTTVFTTQATAALSILMILMFIAGLGYQWSHHFSLILAVGAFILTVYLIQSVSGNAELAQPLSELGRVAILAVPGLGLAGIGVLLWQLRIRTDVELSRIAIVLAFSLGLLIANSMSGLLTVESWLVPVALIASMFTSSLLEFLPPALLLGGFLGVLFFALTLSGLQVQKPYEWWGITEEATSVALRTSSLPALTGFTLHEAAATRYEALALQVEDAERALGRPARILAGPNVAGLTRSVLHVPRYESACVIIWFDVCPDELIQRDLQNLREDEPDLVLWNRMPPWVIEGHEEAFLSPGSSSLRDLSQLIDDWRSSSEFVTYPTVDSSALENEWGIEMLRRR